MLSYCLKCRKNTVQCVTIKNQNLLKNKKLKDY